MKCRELCGACCIAPSISSPIPGMPHGKKAGERCIQLNEKNQCKIFNDISRPRVCSSLKPSKEMCGRNFDEAMGYLSNLEILTK
jgi:Fe-S-cluster containining protein